MQQAQDFLAESDQLSGFISTLPGGLMDQPTGFKSWTGHDILRHLHLWNLAALNSLADNREYESFIRGALPAAMEHALRPFELEYSDGLSGDALAASWRHGYAQLALAFDQADPAQRVKWAGLTMSARSSISARLMETWAHAQALYDLAGVQRKSCDRIHNIAMLGFNTYAWTFKCLGREAPAPQPYVRITAPSGSTWEFGEPSDQERIEGTAEEFCQVVTQTRNIADTSLQVSGPNATEWMREAQCFAGPRETPPAAGTRKQDKAQGV